MPDTIPLPPLGTHIAYTAILKRKEVDLCDTENTPVNQRRPDRYRMCWLIEEVPMANGYVMGVRTVTDGWTHDMSEEGARIREWQVISSQRCLLVAFDLRRKPIFVPMGRYTVLQEPSLEGALRASLDQLARRQDRSERVLRLLADDHGITP